MKSDRGFLPLRMDRLRLSTLWLALLMLLVPWDAAPARKAAGTHPRAAGTARETAPPAAATPVIALAIIVQDHRTAFIPHFETPVTDAALVGARLAIEDNNTTGRFTGQKFTLTEVKVAAESEVRPALERLIADRFRFILVDVSSENMSQLGQLAGLEGVLIFDVGSRDDALRGAHCGGNVLHTLPSRAMLADALGQYLLGKRWTKWFVVVGPDPADRLFAAAVQRAAKRFGAKIVAEKTWTHTFDDRRTPESAVPVFTQGIDYDVLVVADEANLFGDYLSYRTWLPRPVAGTHGLISTAWHPTLEAWGALQLQNRFRERAGRWMGELDYGAWLAGRALGEAATRTRSGGFAAIRDYLLSDQFTLAGFKGVPLSFRRWDRQLRQPVLLAQPRSLIAVAPLEGFLHPRNELDTLGYDESESACRAAR